MAYENLRVMPKLDPNKEYTIEELTDYVRNAVVGENVREALARSMEATNEIATWARDVAQGLIDGAFDAGELATMIESKMNQLEQDYAPKLTSLETEIEDARGNDSSLGGRLDEFDLQLSQKAHQSDVQNINLMAQAPKPTKQGANTSTPKLVIKRGNDYFRIIQKANKGYVDYNFNSGGGTDVSSYGENWELVRLKSVRHLEDAYLAYANHVNPIGNLVESVAPSQAVNSVEMRVTNYNANTVVNTANISNKTGNAGIGLYYIEHATNPSSIDWIIKAGKQKKANILMWANANSSDDVDILVNGVVVKKVNPKAYFQSGSEVFIVEFDIPINQATDSNITITLRNNSLTGRAYFSCVNFKKLKDYDGEHVDLYKTIATNLRFIDAEGASDYAIKEKYGNWFGSYHGGEIREIGRMTFKKPSSPFVKNNSDIGLYNFSDIPLNDWCVLDSVSIYQQTNLINKAKMISHINFDVDGTLDMDFALYDNSVSIDIMYTALTCTHTDFKYVTYPIVKQIEDNRRITEFDIEIVRES